MGCPRLTYENDHTALSESWEIFSKAQEKSESEQKKYVNYYAFGWQMPGRNSNPTDYSYGFNGYEKDDEWKGDGNSLDFGERIYDPRISRFLSMDPKSKSYPYWSPYLFGANNPIRFVDIYGEGPDDRVAKAESFDGTDYSQAAGLNTGSELRTGTSDAALQYLDCSELVCRVLADDNITSGVKLWNTAALVTEFNDTEKWHKSDVPEPGDIFLWRSGSSGHTGVVTGYDPETETVTIAHAKGTADGTIKGDEKSLTYFTNHTGWKGFFRPTSELDKNLITLEKMVDEAWSDYVDARNQSKENFENGNFSESDSELVRAKWQDYQEANDFYFDYIESSNSDESGNTNN